MLMFMKLLGVLLFSVCMSVHAKGLAQDVKVTIDLKECLLDNSFRRVG